MDVNSGSVHIVDDVVYDVLPYLEKKESKEEILKALANSYAPAEIEEALEECHELEEAGALFTEDIYENAIDAFKNRPTVVKALCLHIAHDCNLACRYCFAEEGEYHGRRALMRSRQKSTGFPDRKFRKQKKSGSGFLWRGAADELAGSKRPGCIRKRAGEDP